MYEIGKVYNQTKYVKVMNDIDGSGFDWHPIGQTGARDGTNVQFDGNEHIISNIAIDNTGLTSADKSGLFKGIINPFHMYDVIFENVDNIDNGDNIVIDGWAIIAGRATYDMYSSGQYKFERVGIVDSTVDTSSGKSSNSDWTPVVGSFIGQTYGDPGDVTLMTNCFVTTTTLKVNMSAHDSYVGGIFGSGSSGHWDYSYATTEITSAHDGGFGALADALNPYYYVYDYFNNDVITGLLEDTYYPEYGENTTQMKIQSTYSGFDFTNTWSMSNSGSVAEGYPVFKWATTYVFGTPTPTPTPTPTGTPVVTTYPTGVPTTMPTPTPTGTTSLYVKPAVSVAWSKNNGTSTTTSAYLGESLTITFDTLASASGTYPFKWYVLKVYHKDMQTNTWYYNEYPSFKAIKPNETVYTTYPSNTWIDISPEHNMKGYNEQYKTGYTYYPTNTSALRVELIGQQAGGYVETLGTADISLTKSPFIITNFADWLKYYGGEGLAYLVAIVIILLLAAIPFLLLHRMIVILEMMMIAIGLGFCLLAGLISLWIVFGVGVGLVAIFILTRNSGVQ
jgi:hypothetical protein